MFTDIHLAHRSDGPDFAMLLAMTAKQGWQLSLSLVTITTTCHSISYCLPGLQYRNVETFQPTLLTDMSQLGTQTAFTSPRQADKAYHAAAAPRQPHLQ